MGGTLEVSRKNSSLEVSAISQPDSKVLPKIAPFLFPNRT